MTLQELIRELREEASQPLYREVHYYGSMGDLGPGLLSCSAKPVKDTCRDPHLNALLDVFEIALSHVPLETLERFEKYVATVKENSRPKTEFSYPASWKIFMNAEETESSFVTFREGE